MTVTYVIAKGGRQFENWCHENKVSPESPLVCYVPDGLIFTLCGVDNPSVVYYGTYYERKDIDAVDSFIQERQVRVDKKRFFSFRIFNIRIIIKKIGRNSR